MNSSSSFCLGASYMVLLLLSLFSSLPHSFTLESICSLSKFSNLPSNQTTRNETAAELTWECLIELVGNLPEVTDWLQLVIGDSQLLKV